MAIKQCETCKKLFKIYPSQTSNKGRRTRKFCSQICYRKYYENFPELKQKINQKKSDTLRGRHYHMSVESRQKLSAAHKKRVAAGLHHNYKGGITPENVRIRTSSECHFWRRSCLERDNFTCQKYGTRGGMLRVHHINNFADFPELRLAIDNGITLSDKAHREFHKKYGVKNNTREQLEVFLS